MSRMMIISAAVAVIGLGAYFVTKPANNVTPANPLGAASAQEQTDVDTSTIMEMTQGNPDAPVTVIEYASFTCPHCASFHKEQFKQLKADYIDTGKIHFIYRDVFFDRFGLWASMIARCGGQDRFFGIADMICSGMADESKLSLEEARTRVWMVDSKGLVSRRRDGKLQEHKLPYARDDKPANNLLEVVKRVKPTVLIGASGQPGSFDEAVINEMAKTCDRPVVFALSNPTSKSECSAEQAYRWTRGKAIFASGSPFAPVRLEGRIFVPGQGNNMFIFPGIGLGAIASGAQRVTDSMFFTAAKTLAQMVTEEELEAGTLYPDLGKIRQISLAIATSVCRLAWDQGLAQYEQPDDIREYVRSCMWHPDYRPYVAA